MFDWFYKKQNIPLGINDRNLNYISEYNSNKSIKIANNKLLTKRVLLASHISTPRLIKYISSYDNLTRLRVNRLPDSFVLKPAKGTEGAGIEIIYNRDKDGKFIVGNGKKWDRNDIINHVARILDGDYSINNTPDIAIFEERIKVTKEFRTFTRLGTPDIRIIIFNKIPVMSYIRIPTLKSEGKANLALGAIGCGIDLATGFTTHGISGKADNIQIFPGTKQNVSGIKIPYFDNMLELSIKASLATGLGFCAIDFLIDREKGPVIVELNARPGLSIQIANSDSMKWRLKKAKDLKIGKNLQKSIRLSKDLFGGEIQDEIEGISGKVVVGLTPKITFKTENYNKSFITSIETKKKFSYIPEEIIKELGIDYELDKAIENKYIINDREFINKFIVKNDITEIILGQNILKNLLIDTTF